MVTTEREIDNNNLCAILRDDIVVAAKSCLQSQRFRYEIESMSLLYTNDSVIAECIVSYPRPLAKCGRARFSLSRADCEGAI